MTLSRIELEDIGSPVELARLIHELDPNLPLAFGIEDLCRRLDISDIHDKSINSFAAALIMHPDKAWGEIIVATGTPQQRRRFSIGHELGHFLISRHRPHHGHQFSCSNADLLTNETGAADLAWRMEAEANRFAAELLMPAKRIRSNLKSRQPDLAEIVRLASEFEVSKAAMARSYVDAHRETLALLVVRDARITHATRPDDFPWIAPKIKDAVPQGSIFHDRPLRPGECSEMEECDPEVWLGPSAARKVDILSEQVLAQSNGWAMIMLHAELKEAG